MIQLYANIYDIIPTEGTWVNKVPYAFLADKDEWNHWTADSWLKDIKKNGIKYQLHIHPSGHVGDGNFRYHCAKQLRHLYIPINPYFFFGLSQPSTKSISVRSPILLPNSPYIKSPVIPSKKELPIIDESTLGHGSNPYANLPIVLYKR